MEATGPDVLLQHEAQGVDAVLHSDRLHRVTTPLDPVTVLELDDVQREPELVHAEVHCLVQQAFRRDRAVEHQLLLASHHPQGAEEPDDSQVVVGVEVGEEDRIHREAGSVADHLPLAALAAVEEEEVGVGLHRQAREVAVDGGLRGGGAEKGEAQQ